MHNQDNILDSSPNTGGNEPNKVPGIEPIEIQYKVGVQLDLEDLIKVMEEETKQKNINYDNT